MNNLTDQQLLGDYDRRRSEPAFAELVRRHIDFVHSAALRMVRDTYLAQDVTQGVFMALAQNARQLADRPVLSGWLHRTAQNLASKAVRTDVRRRAREQEAAAMNELLAHQSEAVWEHIAPHLDAVLGELAEPDRDALLLRYFERKSAREMAETLGISDEAAQKRVTRAVERLREFFAKRGVTTGAGGLVVLITANAVQAAPAGLVVAITAAAALTGTAITTATVTATKAIAMTTLQKTLIATSLAAAVSTGIYEAHQASTLRTQVQTLQQTPPSSAVQIKQLQQERDDAIARQTALQLQNEQLEKEVADLPRLRGELTRLRTSQPSPARSNIAGPDVSDPAIQIMLAMKARADQIARYLEQMPEKKIPELKLLTDVEWLIASKTANFDTEADVRKTLRQLRSLAKQQLPMGGALNAFIRANNGQLPADMFQLKPFFKSALGDAPVDDGTIDAILARYALLHTGNVSDLSPDAWIIAEKAPVDKDYDSRAKFGNGSSTVVDTGIGETVRPDDTGY